MRFICIFRLPAKLKMKSSNSSSADFGTGVASISMSNESVSVLSGILSVAVVSSAAAFFLSVQPVVQNIIDTQASNTIMALFLISENSFLS